MNLKVGTEGHRWLKQREGVTDNKDAIISVSIFGYKPFKGYKGGEVGLTRAYPSNHCRRKAEGMPTEGAVSKKTLKDCSNFRKSNSAWYPSW